MVLKHVIRLATETIYDRKEENKHVLRICYLPDILLGTSHIITPCG